MKTTGALYKAIRAVGKLGKAMEEDMQTPMAVARVSSLDLSDLERLRIQHFHVADIYNRLGRVADAFGRDRRENENP